MGLFGGLLPQIQNYLIIVQLDYNLLEFSFFLDVNVFCHLELFNRLKIYLSMFSLFFQKHINMLLIMEINLDNLIIFFL